MPDSQGNGETERGSGYHNRDGSHFRHVEYRSDLNIKQAGAELCQAQNCYAGFENMFKINLIKINLIRNQLHQN